MKLVLTTDIAKRMLVVPISAYHIRQDRLKFLSTSCNASLNSVRFTNRRQDLTTEDIFQGGVTLHISPFMMTAYTVYVAALLELMS